MYPNYINKKLKGKAQLIKKLIQQNFQEALNILVVMITLNSILT